MIADDSRIPHQIAMLIDSRRALDIVREGRAAWADLAARLASPQS